MLSSNDVIQTKSNGVLKVIKYTSASSVTVKFLDTGYITTAQANAVEQGAVKDKLRPSVHSVGFIGEGKYNSLFRAYHIWAKMLSRCYSDKTQEMYPTYKGCTVDRSWHDFQVFAEWFDLNYSEGAELDKDIKVDGNKIYSPKTCLLVSHKENVIKARAKRYKVTTPIGDSIEVYNLAKYCRDNKLHQGHMVAVSKGKRNTHKGYKVESLP